MLVSLARTRLSWPGSCGRERPARGPQPGQLRASQLLAPRYGRAAGGRRHGRRAEPEAHEHVLADHPGAAVVRLPAQRQFGLGVDPEPGGQPAVVVPEHEFPRGTAGHLAEACHRHLVVLGQQRRHLRSHGEDALRIALVGIAVPVPVRVGDAPLVARPGRAGQAGRLDQGLVTTLVPHIDHGGPAGAGTAPGRQLNTLVGHPAARAGRLAEQPETCPATVPATAAWLTDGWSADACPVPAGPVTRDAADWRSSPWLAARGTSSPPCPAISRQITATPVAIRPRTTTAVARRRGSGSWSGPDPSYGGVVRENIRQLTAPGSRSRWRRSSGPVRAPGS